MPPTLRRGPSTSSVPCSGRTVLSLLLAFNPEPVRPEVSKNRPRKNPVRAELVEALRACRQPFDAGLRQAQSLAQGERCCRCYWHLIPNPFVLRYRRTGPEKIPFGLSLSKPCAHATNPSTRAFDRLSPLLRANGVVVVIGI